MENDDTAPRRFRAGAIRRVDIEAYTALRWVGVLFKAAAVFLAVALLAEFIAGLNLEGLAALPTLLGEAARTLVLAVVLWGGGDLVRLLIHLGHDVRAERVLLARIAFRMTGSEGLPASPLLRTTGVHENGGETEETEPIEEEVPRPEEGREAA